MRVVVVTPPAPVVAWAEADAHLKLDGDTDQQTYVESLIAAATAHIDGPDGWLGRALGVQTLEARFDLISCDRGSIFLPYPPTIDLVSVTYLDANEVEQTADLDDFELLGSELVPAGSAYPWEGGSIRREAGRIRYRAGYVADPTADPLVPALPAPIKAAILLMAGDLFRNRETVAFTSATEIPMSTTVINLLRPFRVYR